MHVFLVVVLCASAGDAFVRPVSRRPAVLMDVKKEEREFDLVVIGGGPVGINAALRASRLGRSAILVDATPPQFFQFTGPTGLYSKALRDSALRLDVTVSRGARHVGSRSAFTLFESLWTTREREREATPRAWHTWRAQEES